MPHADAERAEHRASLPGSTENPSFAPPGAPDPARRRDRLAGLCSGWVVMAALAAAAPVAAVAPSPAMAQGAEDVSAQAAQVVKLVVAPGIDGRIERMITLAVEKQPADKQADAKAALLKAAAPLRDELLATFSAYYATAFTPDELKQLVAFYQSPLGQKAVKVEVDKPAAVNAAIQQGIMKLVALIKPPGEGAH